MRRKILIGAMLVTTAVDCLIVWAFWMILTTGKF